VPLFAPATLTIPWPQMVMRWRLQPCFKAAASRRHSFKAFVHVPACANNSRPLYQGGFQMVNHSSTPHMCRSAIKLGTCRPPRTLCVTLPAPAGGSLVQCGHHSLQTLPKPSIACFSCQERVTGMCGITDV
jgi:hypothetical protein